jgi:4-alpha-glucanotransferase
MFRSSGVLAHLTSLAGPFGVGDLGPSARRFAAMLSDLGQTWWQMLPIGPVGHGNSPYSSPSAFAGETLLISPEDLAAEGLVRSQDPPRFPATRVDYDRVRRWKRSVLAEAIEAVAASEALDRFREENRDWLPDFALYTALKEAHGGRPWWDWDRDLVRRRRSALASARRRLAEVILPIESAQFLFDLQFRRLREFCSRLGVRLIGDLPLYVALDSADTWTHPHLFDLDRDLLPRHVAGVPPDYFSRRGQLWGNPTYRWDRHLDEGFTWWRRRVGRLAGYFDLLRIDHFRGLVAFWAVPASHSTAQGGRWVPGPGEAFFDAIRRDLGRLPFLAEDLGEITGDVVELRRRLRIPGMRVLQFGIDPDSEHHPANHPPDVFSYTGTHDNDTLVGWWASLTERERRMARRSLLLGEGDVRWELIGASMQSKAITSIVPLQDLVGAGSEARMNTPGTVGGNWTWRVRSRSPAARDRRRLLRLTELTGRLPPDFTNERSFAKV